MERNYLRPDSFVELDFTAEEHMGIHSHSDMEFLFIISGRVAVRVEESLYQLNQGDMLLINVNRNHSYSGSLEDAKVLVKLGWMLSFTGVIAYKNARKALEVIDWLPMDRIMIETDSPYLTPEPFRGKRNDSGYVHLVAEAIAQVKGVPPEEVAAVTLENGRRFFGIS